MSPLTGCPNGWCCRCYVESLAPRDLKRLGIDPDKLKPPTAPGDLTGIDKGWDYAPGQNWHEYDQMLLDPKLKRLFGDVTPAAIAHGAADDAIALVLKDFSKEFGESLPAFVSLTEQAGGHFKMATYGNGAYLLPDASGPAAGYTDSLKSALRKIRLGAALTVDEEGMIKTLWHEVGHNRQTGLTTRVYKKGSINEALLEATNEFVALRTYPQFLRAIGGGRAMHRSGVAAISGYGEMVNRLERLLKTVGVKPDDFLERMERISFKGPIDDGRGGTILASLAEGIAAAGRAAGWKGLSKAQVRIVLEKIDQDPAFFNPKLNLLASKKPKPPGP